MKRLLLILCALPAFAGQSIILGNSGGAQAAANTSIAAQSLPFSLELNIDAFPTTLGAFNTNFVLGNPFSLYEALPVTAQANNSNGLTRA